LVNYHNYSDTKECINSLINLTYENYYIVLVDNEFDLQNNRELQKEFKDKIVFINNEKNLGYALANNMGIEWGLAKKCDYFLLINNDAVLQSDALDKMVEYAEEIETRGILGPKMYYYNSNKIYYAGGKINWIGKFYSKGINRIDKGQYNESTITDFVVGACMLIKRIVIEKIGMLPTEYFLGMEDIDYCVTAQKMGFSCVYFPASIAWHKYSASFRQNNILTKRFFWAYRGRVIFYKKHSSKIQYVCRIIRLIVIETPIKILYEMFREKSFKIPLSIIYGLVEGFSWIRN